MFINKETVPIISILYGDEVVETKTIWSVPKTKNNYIEIRNDFWSATFGLCQDELAKEIGKSVLICDFSRVCWVDPIPLLSIFIAIKSYCTRTRSSFKLLLGPEPLSENESKIRGGFLKFVSQHGFIPALDNLAVEVLLGSKSFSTDMEELYEMLSSNMFVMAYPNSLCLDAIIEPVSKFQCEDDVTRIVSEWVKNIKQSRMKGFFEGEPELFVELIDKVHILLFEILLNAGEHVYKNNEDDLSNSYIGVYARIRDQNEHEGKLWLHNNGLISDESKCCPGFVSFGLKSSVSTWLEIFYVDQGCGLLSDFES